MRILQKGFNYSQDGPGNRLIYHLQGCNFKCKWCSNPESMPLFSDKAEDVPNDDVVKEIERSRMMFFDGGVSPSPEGNRLCSPMTLYMC